MKDVSRYIAPSVLILFGLILVILKFTKEQNTFFLLGGLAILIVGAITLLNALEMISGKMRLAVVGLLALLSLGLVVLDYKSIKDPIDFVNERTRRYEYVKQRLIDIRTMQIAFKASKGRYSGNFDELVDFVKTDSFLVIMAIGTVPDTLTEDSAVMLGIVRRDTSFLPVRDSLFSKHYLRERKTPFYLDSLPFVPFAGGAKFSLDAGQIERNKVPVHVFQAIDSKPYDPKLVYQVGSMTEPSTSGNWE